MVRVDMWGEISPIEPGLTCQVNMRKNVSISWSPISIVKGLHTPAIALCPNALSSNERELRLKTMSSLAHIACDLILTTRGLQMYMMYIIHSPLSVSDTQNYKCHGALFFSPSSAFFNPPSASQHALHADLATVDSSTLVYMNLKGANKISGHKSVPTLLPEPPATYYSIVSATWWAFYLLNLFISRYLLPEQFSSPFVPSGGRFSGGCYSCGSELIVSAKNKQLPHNVTSEFW